MDLKNQHRNSADQIPFYIRIGVCGHRNIIHAERIRAAVGEVLKTKIFSLFNETPKHSLASIRQTPFYFSAVTPLAEGADRLVAREIMRYPFAELEAILPLVPNDYTDDFSTEDSKQDFQELLALSKRPVIIQKGQKNGDDCNSEVERQKRRGYAYEEAGQYVVDHCDVLIVVWDGKPVRGRGGTADTVDYAKSIKCPVILISSKDASLSVFRGRGISLDIPKGMERFNATYVDPEEKKRYEANIYSDLFGQSPGKDLDHAALQAVKEHLIPLYVRASIIAKKQQKIYCRAGFFVYFFSACSVASVALGILIPKLAFSAYFLELLLLLGIVTIVSYARRKESHRQWFENRFLCERLRSAFIFTACGLPPERIELPGYLRGSHQQDWMIAAYETACQRISLANGHSLGEKTFSFVKEKWLDDQFNYHAAKAKTLRKKSHRLEKMAFSMFSLAIVSASLHLLLHFAHFGWTHLLEQILTYLAICLPAFGAAVGGIKAHRDYERLAIQSKNQADALEILGKRLDTCKNNKKLIAFLRDIDEIMLRETEDWLMLVRFLKIEAAA